MQKHFVVFYSPGALFSETTERQVDTWDVDAAVKLAQTVMGRRGAYPYGFCFTTRSRGDDDLDSRESDRSPFYYLGGRIMTLEEVESRNDPEEATLLRNMRANEYDRVIVNTNSWKVTRPLTESDVVLDFVKDNEPDLL